MIWALVIGVGLAVEGTLIVVLGRGVTADYECPPAPTGSANAVRTPGAADRRGVCQEP